MNRKAILILAFLLLLFFLQGPKVHRSAAKASYGYPICNLNAELDYTSLQEAINAAENGDTILVNQGTYQENINVNKSLSIIGENAETTILDGGTGDFTVLITAENVTVSHFTIKAAQHLESGPTHVGVKLDAVTNCTLSSNLMTGGDQGITLDDASQNFIVQNNLTQIHFAVILSRSNANTIRENNFLNDGIAVWLTQSSDGNRIDKNNMTYTGGTQVTGSSSGNIITSNNFTSNSPGIELLSSSNTTLIDNQFVNDGIIIGHNSHTYGNTVQDNFVNGKPLVYLEGISNCTVGDAGQVIAVNCTHIRLEGLNVSRTAIGAQFITADSLEIVGNNFSGNIIDGLVLMETSNTIIADNRFEENGLYGLELYLSQENNVTRNFMATNEFGIFCDSSQSNSFSANNLTGNIQEGIQLASSTGNTIVGNSISGNWYGGVWFLTSSNNTVSQNNITDNLHFPNEYMGIGIRLIFSSNDNKIYHNNIAGNNVQTTVEVQSEGNIWDDGYPSGGNYWGDSNGTDIFSGPHQNETGGDGIIDIPYSIDVNNVDHYPLAGNYSISKDQVATIPEFSTFLLMSLFVTGTLLAVLVDSKKHSELVHQGHRA